MKHALVRTKKKDALFSKVSSSKVIGLQGFIIVQLYIWNDFLGNIYPISPAICKGGKATFF